MKSKSNPLLSLVESFFRDYLSKMRGASPHTIKAYRDSLRLFFIFVAERRKRAVATLQLEDLRVEAVSAFLDHLESQRANTAASRNYRLAALRSFFKHLVRHDLSHAEQYQRVLALESKKTRITPADYLEAEDVRLILKQPDLRSEAGARDYALLLFLYNTGARVSEALTVRVQDLSLQRPRQVRLHGKGRKERCTPLTKQTVAVLKAWLREPPRKNAAVLFPTLHGARLSADSVQYLVRKYIGKIQEACPSLKNKRVSPHVLRHSAAMELLHAGVDSTLIALWLGHESVETTQIYIHAHLALKEAALAKTTPLDVRPVRFKADDRLLQFLGSL